MKRRPRKLTKTQAELLDIISELIYEHPVPLDDIKRLSNFKSFDSSFNALYEKGWVERVKTNDFTNQFKLA